MLSEEDASLDLCLKQWAEEATGELRSVLLSAATRIRALTAENERLKTMLTGGNLEIVESEQAWKLRAVSSEALVAELRAENERLRKALLRLQTGAAVALDTLPEDQQDGLVGNFLAAIHRECCAGLSAGEGADEYKEAKP